MTPRSEYFVPSAPTAPPHRHPTFDTPYVVLSLYLANASCLVTAVRLEVSLRHGSSPPSRFSILPSHQRLAAGLQRTPVRAAACCSPSHNHNRLVPITSPTPSHSSRTNAIHYDDGWACLVHSMGPLLPVHSHWASSFKRRSSNVGAPTLIRHTSARPALSLFTLQRGILLTLSADRSSAPCREWILWRFGLSPLDHPTDLRKQLD